MSLWSNGVNRQLNSATKGEAVNNYLGTCQRCEGKCPWTCDECHVTTAHIRAMEAFFWQEEYTQMCQQIAASKDKMAMKGGVRK